MQLRVRGVHILSVVLTSRHPSGRNGGHLTPGLYGRMHELTALYGPKEAAKSPALERHTVLSIVQIIKDHGWESDVDLVEGGRLEAVFTKQEFEDIERDIKAAEEAGVEGVEAIKWLDADEVKEVQSVDLQKSIAYSTFLEIWDQIPSSLAPCLEPVATQICHQAVSTGSRSWFRWTAILHPIHPPFCFLIQQCG